jgi:hypothetical protein
MGVTAGTAVLCGVGQDTALEAEKFNMAFTLDKRHAADKPGVLTVVSTELGGT